VIRINLLPRRRRADQKLKGGQAWVVVVMVVVLAEVSGLFALYSYTEGTLKRQRRQNAELRTQIDQAKQAVASHPAVKAKLEQLRAREEAIAALQRARTGPTAVLLELARILTPGRGPTVDPARLDELRRDNPLALYTPTWDARRLWLTRFAEDKREVRIVGVARDGEDVSEFARRLNLSSFFEDIQLLPGKRATDQPTGLSLVDFELKAKARY